MKNPRKFGFGTFLKLAVIFAILFIPFKILEKGVQYLIFLSIEKEQLRIVTADDFILTEFGIDPADRAKGNEISFYSRFIPNPTGILSKDINTFVAVSGFLDEAPKPVFGDFLLYYSKPGTPGVPTVYYEYPVEICGQKFCKFDPARSRLRDGTGEQDGPMSTGKSRSEIVSKFGFKYLVTYALRINDGTSPRYLSVDIGFQQRNFIDRLAGQLLQSTPPFYWIYTEIYSYDFITGWSYLREEFNDG